MIEKNSSFNEPGDPKDIAVDLYGMVQRRLCGNNIKKEGEENSPFLLTPFDQKRRTKCF
jgi:hypothetical protein